MSRHITGESVITAYSGNDGFLIVNRHRHPSLLLWMKSTIQRKTFFKIGYNIMKVDFFQPPEASGRKKPIRIIWRSLILSDCITYTSHRRLQTYHSNMGSKPKPSQYLFASVHRKTSKGEVRNHLLHGTRLRGLPNICSRDLKTQKHIIFTLKTSVYNVQFLHRLWKCSSEYVSRWHENLPISS